MKSDYKVRARKFIEQIFPYIEESLIDRRNYGKLCQAIVNFNLEKHRSVKINHGMARRVLITSDYVIKWDYVKGIFCGNSENELRAWNFVKDTPYNYLFAEISRFEYNGYSFYIMPRFNNIDANREDITDYLNEEESDFVNEYFNDLHSENFALFNGHVVIFDYAWNNIED